MGSKNYNSNTSIIWILTACPLILMLLLSQGCSSDMGSANIIESAVNEQTESILMPKLVVEKASYDFGDIKPGSTNTAVFNFANTGDGPLMVTDIKRCCGAVTKVDKEELAPGELIWVHTAAQPKQANHILANLYVRPSSPAI